MPESRGDDLFEQRVEKAKRLRERGIDPYPPRYKPTHTAEAARALYTQRELAGFAHPDDVISIAGRIVALRPMGKAAFLSLLDGGDKLQVYLKKDELGDAYELLKELDFGDFIGAKGKLFKTRTGEITLEASEFTLLAKALRPLPEKWHGLQDVEKRLRQRYLDLISNEEARKIFMVRSKTVSAIRRFFESRGFLEVETPVLVGVAAGASAKPFITHHNALDRDLYLRIALELSLKRLVVGGMNKVYEIGRVFRNEGLSFKHNPEYTLLESYEAYADYQDVMEMVEQMVSSVAMEVLGTTKVNYDGKEIDLKAPWKRLDLRQAIKDTSGVDFEDYPEGAALGNKLREMKIEVDRGDSRGRLIDKLLSTYVEPTLIQPTFLVDYPLDMSPLAKKRQDNPRFVERFEGFAAGMEIANAFTELNDPIDQMERLSEQERLSKLSADGETDRLDEDFVTALEHGMPPTGGLGMGIDRLVMLLTGQSTIREVILFPQLRGK